MDSLLQDVVYAINIWLGELRVKKEEMYNRVKDTRERVKTVVLQMKYEGKMPPEVYFTANLWIDVLNLILTDEQDDDDEAGKKEKDSEISNRQLLLQKILRLFEIGQISREFTYEMITKLMFV